MRLSIKKRHGKACLAITRGTTTTRWNAQWCISNWNLLMCFLLLWYRYIGIFLFGCFHLKNTPLINGRYSFAVFFATNKLSIDWDHQLRSGLFALRAPHTERTIGQVKWLELHLKSCCMVVVIVCQVKSEVVFFYSFPSKNPVVTLFGGILHNFIMECNSKILRSFVAAMYLAFIIGSCRLTLWRKNISRNNKLTWTSTGHRPGLAADSFAWFALRQGTVHKVVLNPGGSQWGQRASGFCWTSIL